MRSKAVRSAYPCIRCSIADIDAAVKSNNELTLKVFEVRH